MDEKKKVLLTGGIIICVAAAAVIAYLLFFRPSKESPVLTEGLPLQEEAKPETEIPVQAETEELSTLDIDLENSDETVRERALGLSANEMFARWLQTEGIIKKFTAAVDSVANGTSPRSQIDFFKPDEKFKTYVENDVTYISPDSYDRYNPAAAVVSSLDAEGCAKLFRQLKPAFQEAYAELGYPEADFQKTLEKAFVELLEVPVLEYDMPVEKKIQTFAFVNGELERMSDAQKHFLRMGPQNVRKIRDKIKEIGKALDMNLTR